MPPDGIPNAPRDKRVSYSRVCVGNRPIGIACWLIGTLTGEPLRNLPVKDSYAAEPLSVGRSISSLQWE